MIDFLPGDDVFVQLTNDYAKRGVVKATRTKRWLNQEVLVEYMAKPMWPFNSTERSVLRWFPERLVSKA